MKTLSGTFTFKWVALFAVAALTVVAIRAFAQVTAAPRPTPAPQKLTLNFTEAELKDDTGNAFKTAVTALKGEQYSVRVKDKSGKVEEVVPSASTGMKIDKVTTSELAKSSAGEFTPIGMHVTQTVTSNSAAEIRSVLDTLK